MNVASSSLFLENMRIPRLLLTLELVVVLATRGKADDATFLGDGYPVVNPYLNVTVVFIVKKNAASIRDLRWQKTKHTPSTASIPASACDSCS